MPAQILKPTPENLALAAEAIRRAEVVGMPTETVYGLAGDALNSLSLARIFETKERPTFDPLIVHVGFSCKRVAELDRLGLVAASKLSPEAREVADRLIERFWPGPLTLVLPKQDLVPDLATSGLPTVAIRMPRHSVAQALIAASGTPLAAPSANRFGRISPTSAENVLEELGDRIDWILDGGHCDIGVESTVLAVTESGGLQLLRPGGVSIEELEKTAPVERTSSSKGTAPQVAPGMLASHYAPRKPMLLLSDTLERLKNVPNSLKGQKKIGLLATATPEKRARSLFQSLVGVDPRCISLSESGDLNEAARKLFQSLRALDGLDVSLIVAEPVGREEGLGYAIQDRLRRAAAPRD